MNPAVVFLIVISMSLATFLGIFIPVSVVRNKYRNSLKLAIYMRKQRR